MPEEFFTLNQYGAPQEVLVRRSVQAKTIRIRITSKGPELVLPLRAKAEHGYNFLLSKECWVRQKLQANISIKVLDDNKLPIFGKDYQVVHTLSNTSSVKILEGTTLEVKCSIALKKAVIELFLKRKLLAEITHIADTISKEYNLHYSNIRIMKSITKWGSCSSKGQLAFNWRIVFAPLEVLRYLVVHEMAHLKEMNHSKNFWQLVARIYPEYLPEKLWLKRNGRKLHGYL